MPYSYDLMDDLMDSQPWDWSAKNKVFCPTSKSLAMYRRDMLVGNDEAHRHEVLDAADRVTDQIDGQDTDAEDEYQEMLLARLELERDLKDGKSKRQMSPWQRHLLTQRFSTITPDDIDSDGNPTFKYDRQERLPPEMDLGQVETGRRVVMCVREAGAVLRNSAIRNLRQRNLIAPPEPGDNPKDLRVQVMVVFGSLKMAGLDAQPCAVSDSEGFFKAWPRRFDVYQNGPTVKLKSVARRLTGAWLKRSAKCLTTLAQTIPGNQLGLERVQENPSTAINQIVQGSGLYALRTGNWDEYNRLREEIRRALFPVYFTPNEKLVTDIKSGQTSLTKVNAALEAEATVMMTEFGVPRTKIDRKLNELAAAVRVNQKSGRKSAKGKSALDFYREMQRHNSRDRDSGRRARQQAREALQSDRRS